MENNNQAKKMTLGVLVSWILGIGLILLGIIMSVSSVSAGMVFFIAAAITLPPSNKLIKEYLKLNISGKSKFAVVAILTFVGLGMGVSDQSTTGVTENNPPVSESVSKTLDTQIPAPAPKTLDEKIPAAISAIKGGSTRVTYRDLKIEKSDSDRPLNTKMITVSVDISDFYNKSALIRDTGKISSAVFNEVYASDVNAYDAFVWYYAKTTDRYGNSESSVVLTYAIDKPTYGKINWDSFDRTKLCDLLQQETQTTGSASTNAGCHVLANIE